MIRKSICSHMFWPGDNIRQVNWAFEGLTPTRGLVCVAGSGSGKGTIRGLRLRDSRDSQDSQDSGTPKTLRLPRLRDFRTLLVYTFGIHFCFHFIVMFLKVMKFIFQISLLGWTIQFHYLSCIWMPACESISFMAYQSSPLVSHHPGAWGAGPTPQINFDCCCDKKSLDGSIYLSFPTLLNIVVFSNCGTCGKKIKLIKTH